MIASMLTLILKSSKAKDALEKAYECSGFSHRLYTIDDDLCRMLKDTGTDSQGRSPIIPSAQVLVKARTQLKTYTGVSTMHVRLV